MASIHLKGFLSRVYVCTSDFRPRKRKHGVLGIKGEQFLLGRMFFLLLQRRARARWVWTRQKKSRWINGGVVRKGIQVWWEESVNRGFFLTLYIGSQSDKNQRPIPICVLSF